MEEGSIHLQNGYSKDNEEIKVFFLKAQPVLSFDDATSVTLVTGSNPEEWQKHPTEPNTWIVDEETAKALVEDNQDCCGELEEWQKQAHEELHMGMQKMNKFLLDEENKVKGIGCCPIGPKGVSGETGLLEEELVIKGVLDQLPVKWNETGRIFLAKEIAKDLRIGGFFKDEYTQF